MTGSNFKSPGVYIQELNAFPNSIVPVATAVPAFIGYTPQAAFDGKSYYNKPVKISSFSDFERIFCIPFRTNAQENVKQYNPQFYISAQESKPAKGNYLNIGNNWYTVNPDASSIYYLYNSIRLFYFNGGGDAYIVSVGNYGPLSGQAATPGEHVINPNVVLGDLQQGLETLKNEPEPTMYICPDATLLSVQENATLMQLMLMQCSEMQTAISVFDIIGGDAPNPLTFAYDITTFREGTGSNGLSYGTAYYPFLNTTVTQAQELDYTNLFGGDPNLLEQLFVPVAGSSSPVQAIISRIKNPEQGVTVSQNNMALLAASNIYNAISKFILELVNILPPSGGMAGVITTTDNQVGVWSAPANTSIVGAVSLPIKLSDQQQAGLNQDPVTGKSVNVIRYFSGMGILVWGARTLDGNNPDLKYLPVRRTLIYLEQSCKLAMQAYVFQPNNKNTWEAIKAMISSFLTGCWKQGALQGAKPEDAFWVQCGLGTTMTGDDVLNGNLIVSIGVALVHPAEFIIISLQQQMQAS